jgi:protoporphyrinogen oxidase
MQCKWLGERVAAPDLGTVVKNALAKKMAGNWGPNSTFLFPSRGGTGGIWKAVAKRLPKHRFRLGQHSGKVTAINASSKEVVMADGTVLKYGTLVSTMAVDSLLEDLKVDTEAEEDKVAKMQAAAQGLVFSSTIVLGIGIRGALPPRIGDKCESNSH